MTIKAQRAKQILSECRRQKVLVVGDLMLDRYIYGSVSRISPEAPVPVVRVSHEKSMPGGASNVAWNIQSLGGRAGVAGILGRDETGGQLRALLEKGGVSTAGTKALPGHPTIVKTRIIAERQQVVRVDREKSLDLSAAELAGFCRQLAVEVGKASGVIIEDYGKGLIRQKVVDTVLSAAKKRRIPVGLDPKENEELKVTGITVATPNRKEAFGIAGVSEAPVNPNPLQDKALRKVGDILMARWRPEFLLLTLGPLGILLLSKGAPPKHVPTRAREVFDVSGAGDTVIATCVLALAAGASPIEAAEIANYAAGVVVGKLGTATCGPEELLSYME